MVKCNICKSKIMTDAENTISLKTTKNGTVYNYNLCQYHQEIVKNYIDGMIEHRKWKGR